MVGGYITLPTKWSQYISEVIFGEQKSLEVEYDNAEKILKDIIDSGKLIVSEKSSNREQFALSPMICTAVELDGNLALITLFASGTVTISSRGNLIIFEFTGG